MVEAIKRHLLPLATIVTPNIPEASKLLGALRFFDCASLLAMPSLLSAIPRLACCRDAWPRGHALLGPWPAVHAEAAPSLFPLPCSVQTGAPSATWQA